MPIQNPIISVIIPCFQDINSLEKTLGSLEMQSEKSFEVIVIDNGSNPPIDLDVVRFPHSRCIREKTRGAYAARNRGVREALGRAIAFTDSDCVAHRDWLKEGLKNLLSSRENCIFGGDIRLVFQVPENPTVIELYDEIFHGFRQKEWVEREGFAATANLFVPRIAFEKVGFFNESLLSGGDAEWTRRAVEAGYPLHYLASAVIFHPARRQFTQISKKIGRVIGGQYRLAQLGKIPPRDKIRNLFELLNPIPKILYTVLFIKTRTTRPLKKIGLAGVVMLYRYIEAWEWFRLYVGKSPKTGT